MRKAAVIFVILCLIAGLGAGAVLYKKYAPTKARADQGAIYGAEGSQVALVLDYELQEQQGVYENGQSYLPLGWVNEHLNERFYWDDGEKLLVYALPESIVYADASTMGTSGTPLLPVSYTHLTLPTACTSRWDWWPTTRISACLRLTAET